MEEVDVPQWLKSLPLAPEYHPTASEFLDPISYILKIEPEASLYGICKIVPPFETSSKEAIISNLNSSLSVISNLNNSPSVSKGAGISSAHGASIPPARCMNGPPNQGRTMNGSLLSSEISQAHINIKNNATFTTRKQQLGWNPKRSRAGIQAFARKHVWESGEYYTVEEFEAKAKLFSRSHLGACEVPNPFIVESLFWKAAIDKPISVEYANDIPGSAFPDYDKLEKGRYGGDDPGKQNDGLKLDVAGMELTDTAWNIRKVARSSGSLLKFMPEEVPGVTSPMVYLGMLFSWFAWHVEDHELHSLNYLHMGAPKTWYAVPSDAASALEEVIRVHGYGGYLSPGAAFALLGEKTTVLSPEILIAAGVPCCRLVQNAGDYVVTFPRAYHLGFSHGFNCGEAANFATPNWVILAREAASRRACMNQLPMLSHEQLLYLMTMALPERFFLGEQNVQAEKLEESLVDKTLKSLFIDDVIRNNDFLGRLINAGVTRCVALRDRRFQTPKTLLHVLSNDQSGLAIVAQPNDDHVDMHTDDKKLKGSLDNSDDSRNMSKGAETPRHCIASLPTPWGVLPCTTCGILSFASAVIVQPSSEAAAAFSIPQTKTMTRRSAASLKDLSGLSGTTSCETLTTPSIAHEVNGSQYMENKISTIERTDNLTMGRITEQSVDHPSSLVIINHKLSLTFSSPNQHSGEMLLIKQESDIYHEHQDSSPNVELPSENLSVHSFESSGVGQGKSTIDMEQEIHLVDKMACEVDHGNPMSNMEITKMSKTLDDTACKMSHGSSETKMEEKTQTSEETDCVENQLGITECHKENQCNSQSAEKGKVTLLVSENEDITLLPSLYLLAKTYEEDDSESDEPVCEEILCETHVQPDTGLCDDSSDEVGMSVDAPWVSIVNTVQTEMCKEIDGLHGLSLDSGSKALSEVFVSNGLWLLRCGEISSQNSLVIESCGACVSQRAEDVPLQPSLNCSSDLNNMQLKHLSEAVLVSGNYSHDISGTIKATECKDSKDILHATSGSPLSELPKDLQNDSAKEFAIVLPLVPSSETELIMSNDQDTLKPNLENVDCGQQVSSNCSTLQPSLAGSDCGNGSHLHSSVSQIKEDWLSQNPISLTKSYPKPYVFCLEHGLETYNRLASLGGADAVIICHSDFAHIEQRAKEMATGIKMEYTWNQISVKDSAMEDLELINFALDPQDAHSEQSARSWVTQLGMSKQYQIKHFRMGHGDFPSKERFWRGPGDTQYGKGIVEIPPQGKCSNKQRNLDKWCGRSWTQKQLHPSLGGRKTVAHSLLQMTLQLVLGREGASKKRGIRRRKNAFVTTKRPTYSTRILRSTFGSKDVLGCQSGLPLKLRGRVPLRKSLRKRNELQKLKAGNEMYNILSRNVGEKPKRQSILVRSSNSIIVQKIIENKMDDTFTGVTAGNAHKDVQQSLEEPCNDGPYMPNADAVDPQVQPSASNVAPSQDLEHHRSSGLKCAKTVSTGEAHKELENTDEDYLEEPSQSLSSSTSPSDSQDPSFMAQSSFSNDADDCIWYEVPITCSPSLLSKIMSLRGCTARLAELINDFPHEPVNQSKSQTPAFDFDMSPVKQEAYPESLEREPVNGGFHEADTQNFPEIKSSSPKPHRGKPAGAVGVENVEPVERTRSTAQLKRKVSYQCRERKKSTSVESRGGPYDGADISDEDAFSKPHLSGFMYHDLARDGQQQPYTRLDTQGSESLPNGEDESSFHSVHEAMDDTQEEEDYESNVYSFTSTRKRSCKVPRRRIGYSNWETTLKTLLQLPDADLEYTSCIEAEASPYVDPLELGMLKGNEMEAEVVTETSAMVETDVEVELKADGKKDLEGSMEIGGYYHTRLRKQRTGSSNEELSEMMPNQVPLGAGKKATETSAGICKKSSGRKRMNKTAMEDDSEETAHAYQCDLEGCVMGFATEEELMQHKLNMCTFEGCGKTFGSHKYLAQHRKVHKDDRPLKCPWKGCTMAFKWPWARTEHIRVHTGERPYACPVCNRTFRFVSDFSRHKRNTGHARS